ncbi:tRNA (guanosine(46)-N7)-methyltransferase TrmB [Knoellia sp. 3-2P3]|uniref:tRNA (guanosine(46)-N7)-methyltransferase TrmB n=1 Tax=unclassified Knoellia TaxID=2618719 RepID=UPI0023DB9491|nr:tRNA (guanosine(46)-N7)-methyltransferase TrmB [Knoellia sp. 3-2P3]MDF2092882.1 tRNA (guanosine(46)-N7)-methyltransferase TrmB [Knoellia sp. 3-2P3]
MTSQPRVRTYNARRGRMSPLTQSRLAELGPRHGIPEGPLEPEAAFGRRAPLVLDIGCGHGAAAIAYAVEHPGHDVLAVDVHPPGVARMLAAADARGVRNLWAHIGDAVALLETRIAPRSLHAVHLFFPDPWPKARHLKRRFIREHTLDLIADRLEPGGALLVATDHQSYAAHALDELEAHRGFAVGAAARPAWRPHDGFEAKGLAAGRSVTDLRAVVRLSGGRRTG